MRFIVDENMPRLFAGILRERGFDASHVQEIGYNSTDDELILDFAAANGYVIITFDLDFSRLVALGN